MSEGEKLIVGLTVSAVLLLAPAYLLHISPRFPGSFVGGLVGISAAILMLICLIYPIVKYIGPLKRATSRLISMRTLLAVHVYTGILGPLLGIIHSGHRYESPLGIALVVTALTTVVSGFVGRYYLAHVSSDLREQQSLLARLREAYNAMAAGLASRPVGGGSPPRVPLLALVGGIADLEYSITGRDALRRSLNRWIVVHVAAAVGLYVLLTLHVWGEVYHGLRWLQ